MARARADAARSAARAPAAGTRRRRRGLPDYFAAAPPLSSGPVSGLLDPGPQQRASFLSREGWRGERLDRIGRPQVRGLCRRRAPSSLPLRADPFPRGRLPFGPATGLLVPGPQQSAECPAAAGVRGAPAAAALGRSRREREGPASRVSQAGRPLPSSPIISDRVAGSPPRPLDPAAGLAAPGSHEFVSFSFSLEAGSPTAKTALEDPRGGAAESSL